MLRITIEFVPQGDESRSQVIHTGKIWNDLTGTKTTGNYHFQLMGRGQQAGCGLIMSLDNRGRHGNHATGQRHYRWNNSRIVSSHGYVKIRVGVEHPLADPNGHAYEHLLVWVSAGNPRPEKGQVMHHLNHDSKDNRLDNLCVIQRGDHTRHHNQDKTRNGQGRFTSQKGGLVRVV